jgi:hypothetical protein
MAALPLRFQFSRTGVRSDPPVGSWLVALPLGLLAPFRRERELSARGGVSSKGDSTQREVRLIMERGGHSGSQGLPLARTEQIHTYFPLFVD